jgi:hypothetical protein
MADKKMLILRGNPTDDPDTYPDEQGKTRAWPDGALHEKAARAFARKLGYADVVIEAAGLPQGPDSKQATKALDEFHKDKDVTIGFYGFSGGGYNVWHILKLLAATEPQSLRRIDRVVVIGAPNKIGGKDIYKPAYYTARVSDKAKGKDWKLEWDLIFRVNPDPSQLPNGIPEGTDTHMFGPDVLLAGWPEDFKPPAKPHRGSKK